MPAMVRESAYTAAPGGHKGGTKAPERFRVPKRVCGARCPAWACTFKSGRAWATTLSTSSSTRHTIAVEAWPIVGGAAGQDP